MDAHAVAPPLVVRSVAGPDAGWTRSLGVGRHWVGRAGDLAVADPAVEAHQALLEVGPTAVARLLHVAGRSATRVDGEPATSWSHLAPGATIEIGHTRLVAGRRDDPTPGSVGHVYVPLNASDDELMRFERDVRSAVAAATAAARRSPGTVVLGEGRLPVDIGFRDGADRPVTTETLGHVAHRIVDRVAAPIRSVTTDVTDTIRMGVAAPDPDAVVGAMLAQLAPARRAKVIVAGVGSADLYCGVARPVVVTASRTDDLPGWCTALLDVGATWQATWQPDRIGRPDVVVRLHARGRARVQPCPAPGGRLSLSR